MAAKRPSAASTDTADAAARPYAVLARRYRSRTFDEVVGQEHVAQTLKRAIETGRVHHAYLFTGTRGVGKTSMARILAAALNDPTSDGPTPTPSADSDTARAIFRGEDVDVIEIDAASRTSVEGVRELIENAAYRPMHSRYKIYIIDEAHMLSKNAFNALLKIMEEPPEHVKFILATTEPDKLLPTILSRVQRFDFRNIPAAEIAQHLAAVCRQEGLKAEDDALLLVARNGAGSMRDSLSLLDRLISGMEKGATLTTETVTELLGLPPMQRVFELVEAIGEGDAKAALARAEAILAGGQSADSMVAALIDHLHALLIRTVVGGGELADLLGLDEQAVTAQAQRFEPATLSQNIAILEELRRQLRSSAAGRALLDATLVRLALAGQFTPVGELLAAANGGPRGASPASGAEKKTPGLTARAGEAPAAAAGPARREPNHAGLKLAAAHPNGVPGARADDSGNGPASLHGMPACDAGAADLTELWSRLRAVLRAQRESLNALLEGAHIDRIDLPSPAEPTAAVEIGFDAAHAPLAKMLERNGKKEQVADALAALLGLPAPPVLHLRVRAPEASPDEPSEALAPPRARQQRPRASPDAPARPAARAAPALAEASATVPVPADLDFTADPLVAAAIRELGARVVKVEGKE